MKAAVTLDKNRIVLNPKPTPLQRVPAMQLRIDGAELWIKTTTYRCRVAKVGLEPNMTDAAGRLNGSFRALA